MSEQFQFDVFLSHNAKDKPRVRKLAALASGWVALERSTAVYRDPANAGRRFIPLLPDDCALPETLRRYKDVDFREEAEAAFAEVCETKQRHKPMLDRFHANLHESPTLAILRDTLLPKLLNGELAAKKEKD